MPSQAELFPREEMKLVSSRAGMHQGFGLTDGDLERAGSGAPRDCAPART